MNIAFIYDAVYPYEKGGAQKRVWEIAKRLAEEHEVHWYGMKYWDGEDEIQKEGVTLHGICPAYDLYCGDKRSIFQAINFGRAVRKEVDGKEHDIIDCQQFPYFSVIAADRMDTPMVTTWYEVWDDYWYDYIGKKGVFGKLIERWTIYMNDHIVPISEHIESNLREVGYEGESTVVHNGVDFDRLTNIGGEMDTDSLLYVGRLAEHKRVEDFIRSAEELGQGCTIVGDGPERERLEQIGEEVSVEVDFKGFVEEHDDVVRHMRSADVMVLPSEREGFPNTILEANAVGTPVVTVAHPENGGKTVVKDGQNGYVASEASDLTGMIENCLDDDLETASIKYAKAHDWNKIVAQLEQIYEGEIQ